MLSMFFFWVDEYITSIVDRDPTGELDMAILMVQCIFSSDKVSFYEAGFKDYYYRTDALIDTLWSY